MKRQPLQGENVAQTTDARIALKGRDNGESGSNLKLTHPNTSAPVTLATLPRAKQSQNNMTSFKNTRNYTYRNDSVHYSRIVFQGMAFLTPGGPAVLSLRQRIRRSAVPDIFYLQMSQNNRIC